MNFILENDMTNLVHQVQSQSNSGIYELSLRIRPFFDTSQDQNKKEYFGQSKFQASKTGQKSNQNNFDSDNFLIEEEKDNCKQPPKHLIFSHITQVRL